MRSFRQVARASIVVATTAAVSAMLSTAASAHPHPHCHWEHHHGHSVKVCR